MEKTKKRNIIIGISVIAIIVVVLLILLLANREESYRVVKIYELDGTATVTREETGEIDIYPNMVLASGDEVYLDEGVLTLKLDEDKYVYVEEKTRFSIVATGNAENSKTRINLMEGAIVNEITAPLGADSSYEVHTQNSSMSVRGTTFRVAITYDENDVMYTKVSVFKGAVETQLVFKDGTVADPRLVEDGKETIIFEDDLNTDYLEEVSDIRYEELTKTAIEALIGIVKEGSQLSVTETELMELLDRMNRKNDKKDKEEEDMEETEPQVTEEETPAEETEEEEEETPEADSEDVTDNSDTTETNTNDSTAPSATYTVTFMYGGSKFATQTVSAGAQASKPLLVPEASGSWDFDFSTAITKDTTIEWN